MINKVIRAGVFNPNHNWIAQNHKSQEIPTVFPSNSPNSSRTFKNNIHQNSFNSSSIRVILFAVCSMNMDLQLFWESISITITNLNCSFLVHQWQIAFSSNRSNLELTWSFQLPCWASISTCFKESRAETSRFNTVSNLRCDFESHHFVNCDMRSIVLSM